MDGRGRVPSVKGALLEYGVEDLKELVERGRISRAELDAMLSPEERAILDEKIQPSLFYPLSIHIRFLELICKLVFDGTLDGHRELGVRHARKMRARVDYQDPTPPPASSDPGRTRHRGPANVLFSFSNWLTEWDDFHSGQKIVKDAAPFPEWYPARLEGYIEELQRTALPPGMGVKVSSERPSPDRILLNIRRVELERRNAHVRHRHRFYVLLRPERSARGQLSEVHNISKGGLAARQPPGLPVRPGGELFVELPLGRSASRIQTRCALRGVSSDQCLVHLQFMDASESFDEILELALGSWRSRVHQTPFATHADPDD